MASADWGGVIRPIEQQVCAAWFQSKHDRGSRPSSAAATQASCRRRPVHEVNLYERPKTHAIVLTSNRLCGKKTPSRCVIGSLSPSATNWISKQFSNISSKLSSKSQGGCCLLYLLSDSPRRTILRASKTLPSEIDWPIKIFVLERHHRWVVRNESVS